MYKREKVVKEEPIPWCSLSYKGINTHKTESKDVTSVLYQVMKLRMAQELWHICSLVITL